MRFWYTRSMREWRNGSASVSQTEGCGFEPRFPLAINLPDHLPAHFFQKHAVRHLWLYGVYFCVLDPEGAKHDLDQRPPLRQGRPVNQAPQIV